MFIKPFRGIQLNRSHPLARGLVGAWLMNEGSGQKICDLSGNQNTGTFATGSYLPAWTQGKFGFALKFDGGDYIDCATPSTLNSLQVPMTISGWFKQNNTTGNQVIFGQYNAPTNHKLIKMIRVESGTLKYYTSASNGAYQSCGTLTPTVTNWHFFAIVVSGGISSPIVTIYLDSASQSSSLSALSSTPDTTVPVHIGNDNRDWTGINGLIDNLLIYNRVLSAAEVAKLYCEPFAMFEAPLAGRIARISAGVSYTKTFTSDVVLQASLTKTFISDVLIQILDVIKTFTADTLLQVSPTKAFTADAVLVSQPTKTFTADVILSGAIKSKSFTADVQLTAIRYIYGTAAGRSTAQATISATLLLTPLSAIPVPRYFGTDPQMIIWSNELVSYLERILSNYEALYGLE